MDEAERDRPDCVVVICTRNRPQHLDSCIRAVLSQHYDRFGVLVVDNGSDNSQSFQLAAAHGVRCVSEPSVGLSHARNRGAFESTAEIIAYIDDDAIPEERWLDCLCREFDDPRAMAVVGRILPSMPDTEGARMCLDMGIYDGGPNRFAIDNDFPRWFERLRADVRGGANMAFRRSAFAVWPGFDTRLGLGAAIRGGEEDYAFLSLIKSGHRVIYTPDARVRHPFPDTATELRQRHLETLTTSAGFLAFLFAAEPECRGTVLRHLMLHIPRSHRRSYQLAPDQARALAPLWREALAGVAGLANFARSAIAPKSRVVVRQDTRRALERKSLVEQPVTPGAPPDQS